MTAQLVDEYAAAEMLAVSVKTLRRWRWAGREVPFVKIGSAVRYDVADIAEYLKRQKRATPQCCE
jgi:predicted site-specific integrase-resolvase